MGLFEKFLKKIVIFQSRHYYISFLVIASITIFMLFGVPKIKMESDLSKSMPQDLDIYKLNERVSEKFGGQDIILILLTLDNENNFKDMPKDIRNIDTINYISKLSESLNEESSIESITSVGNIFSKIPNLNQAIVDNTIKENPEINQYFSEDFQSTFMMVRSDIGSSEEKVNQITKLIKDKIDSFSKPAGTKIMVTGNPPMRTTILEILFSDAKNTLLIACILIFILLLILERSFIRSILIYSPLMIGLVWTIGSMGWLGIEISMATAGLGAMILGLGVEYGVFMLMRYLEERKKGNNPQESLILSVPSSGIAIMGSGFTTIVGFGSLALSILPMMQKLGISLALGIAYCLFSAIFVAPIIFIISEEFVAKFDESLYLFFKKKHETKNKI